MVEEKRHKMNLPVWKEDYDLILKYQVLKSKKNLMDAVADMIKQVPFDFSTDDVVNAINSCKKGYGFWRLSIIKSYLLSTIKYLNERKSNPSTPLEEVPIIDKQLVLFNDLVVRVDSKVPKLEGGV